MRTYSELMKLKTFEERFSYLRLDGRVGEDTFGFDRYLNQGFYRSKEWKQIRDFVILRDNGCDLGCADREIAGKVIIHHMNPITSADIVHGSDLLTDPEYLIAVSHDTHNAIHYGDEELLPKPFAVRRAGDTCLWRR